MSFNECLDNVLKSEGGYSDDKSDSGGATNFGITIGDYSDFLGRKATKKEVRDMPLDDAKKIYKKRYWDKMQLDNVNCPMIQMLLFNQGVNVGCGGAVKRAQCVINDHFHGTLIRDGGIGKLTLAALNQISIDGQSSLFVSEYLHASRDFYTQLCIDKPSQLKFIKGWMNRLHDLEISLKEV